MKSVDKRRLICTEDGSSSLQLLDFDEQFHSIHGAYAESMHVYINAGLQAVTSLDMVSVLEMGLGTGLNAFLTYLHKEKSSIRYHGVEAFPLVESEWKAVNFPGLEDENNRAFFAKLHGCRVGEWPSLDDHFLLFKEHSRFEDADLGENRYDLVYFDAFSPDVQPELWTEDIFRKVYHSMRENGVFVTYCAKGVVKRALKSVGFELESLPGPIGKREITRCIKKY